VVILFLGVAAVFGWHDLRVARADLTSARSMLQQTQDDPSSLADPSGRQQAVANIDQAMTEINAAHRQVAGSWALSTARFIPWATTQRGGVMRLIDDSEQAASTGRGLLMQVDQLAKTGRLQGGSVSPAAMAQLEGDLRQAGSHVYRLVGSPAGLWGPLGDARKTFDELATKSAARLTEGADASEAARAFLGVGGMRHYLVALQNNAEMRDQGMVLSYADVTFDNGHLHVVKTGRIPDLMLSQPVNAAVAPGTAEVFGGIEPTQLWQSVNATADFSWSGQTMAAMYHQATGQSVDGVIAMDVPALAHVLQVTGPVAVPGFAQPVSAGNVAQLVLHDQYESISKADPTQAERKEAMSDLMRVVSDRLTTGNFDTVALGRQLGQAAAGGHLKLWSSVPDEEQTFQRTGLAGGPAALDPSRTFHLAVENRTATKLDYYVHVEAHQEIQLTKLGTAIVHTTVTVKNEAPVGAAPSYQLGPDQYTQHPGDYIAWVLLWGPSGSAQEPGGPDESGLQLSQAFPTVAAGQQATATFETLIPYAVQAGKLDLRYVPQPRLDPAMLSVHLDAPDWHVNGPPDWSASWSQTQAVSWSVSQ
jgi:hypothetical protein